MEAPAAPPLAPQQQQQQQHDPAHGPRHPHAPSHSVGRVGPPPHPPFASGSAPSSSSGSAIVPVRLPPVSLPPADFLEAPGFNPGRRQSVNSDPFLHAFSGAHHPHPPSHLNESFSTAPAPDHARRDDLPQPPAAPPPGAMPMEVLRAPSPRDHHAMHDAPYPPPPGSAGPSHDGYEYGAPPYDEHPHPHPGMSYEPGPVVPAASYRFGGPSQGSNAPLPPPPPPDGASYHDYPMSRPPMSHRGSGQSSPGRSSLPRPPQPPRPLDQPPRHSPTPSLKRKTSDESAAHEEGYGSYPANSPYLRGPPSGGAAPHPKRRTSTLTYEKLNGLSLAEQQRRDSSFGPISPWEEDRRGSDESYGSHGSHGYPVPAYQHVHPSVQGYELRAPPSSSSAPPQHAMPHGPGPAWDGQQVGPRGSIARGMYGDGPSSFARRPSIPSVSQMMQGQQPFYPVGGAPPAHPSPAGPPPTWPPPPPHSRPPPHPSLTVSSEPPTPVSELDDPNSRPHTSSSYPPPLQQPHQPHSSGPPPGPPAPWARGGPPIPPPGLNVSRHNSSGSVNLDPSSAYAPGQGPPSKETPYSRSPELRVSHKLAERKRRKEMAQLFEDLREQLPFDRGLKASKWEILSKANEYVASLKAFTEELIADNRALREHFNLPPGPTAPPPDASEAHDETPRGPVDSSQDSSQIGGTSHEASPAPAAATAPAGMDYAAPHPGGNTMSPSHSQQNLAAMQQQQQQGAPGSMPQHQWPQRPSSRSSYAGQVSPALGTVALKQQQQQQQRLVSGPPQPSPTLSQHSAPMSPPLGRGLSSTAGADARANVGEPQ
ncbi:hypothetical protein JCM9279_001919 [Rhodotorula babjevae]